MYRGFNGEITRGTYSSASTEDPSVLGTPFLKIGNPAGGGGFPGTQHKFIDDNGTCYILYGIKASRSLVIDELILNYFKLFSVQKD